MEEKKEKEKDKQKKDWFWELVEINLDLVETMLLLFGELLWNLVATVPSVTASAVPSNVDIGGSVTIAGVVNSDTNTPATSAAVALTVTDAAGKAQTPISATTDSSGNYSVSFVVPVGFASGAANVVVVVASLGITTNATFTHNNTEKCKNCGKEIKLIPEKRGTSSWCQSPGGYTIDCDGEVIGANRLTNREMQKQQLCEDCIKAKWGKEQEEEYWEWVHSGLSWMKWEEKKKNGVNAVKK